MSTIHRELPLELGPTPKAASTTSRRERRAQRREAGQGNLCVWKVGICHRFGYNVYNIYNPPKTKQIGVFLFQDFEAWQPQKIKNYRSCKKRDQFLLRKGVSFQPFPTKAPGTTYTGCTVERVGPGRPVDLLGCFLYVSPKPERDVLYMNMKGYRMIMITHVFDIYTYIYILLYVDIW